MTAGIDLALAMVEKDLGADVARAVARKLVVYYRRAGGQSQFSALLELEPKSDRIQSALTYAKPNLDKPLTVEQLAEAAHLNPRQFSRAFHAETASRGQGNREVARRCRPADDGAEPPSSDVVARQTGFADRDRMRRAFLRAFGQPPQVIRRNTPCRGNGLNCGRTQPSTWRNSRIFPGSRADRQSGATQATVFTLFRRLHVL